MLILSSALLLFGQGQAPQAVSPAAQIAQAFSKALDAKDEGWFESHLALGFTLVDEKGETKDRAEVLRQIHRWMHPLGYRVETSLALVSAQTKKNGLMLLSDLTVRSQLFGFRRMPLRVAKAREESFWVNRRGMWQAKSIRILKLEKTVDGVPEVDD